jgi:hypothetical protein
MEKIEVLEGILLFYYINKRMNVKLIQHKYISNLIICQIGI